MNKITKNIIIGMLTFGIAGIAAADTTVGVNASVQTNTKLAAPTSSSTPIKPLDRLRDAKMNAKMEITSIKANLASTTVELRAEIKQRMQKRAENRLDKMTERFEATIEREGKILTRINSRIAKVKTAGGDTTESEKFALEAKLHLDEADSSLTALETSVENSIEAQASTTTKIMTKEMIANLKKSAAEVEKHLRAAHAASVNAVSSLQGMSTTEAKVNASSTTQVNP